MSGRIAFSKLVEKVQSGTLTQNEAEKYFVYDSLHSKAFNPGIAINENNVDTAGVERTALSAAYNLGIEASKVANANYIASLAKAPKPDGSIIAEGDSWFHLPSWYQKTMIDWLQENYPITNIAHQGYTLEDIVKAGKYVDYVATGKVRILMFSAGGNDFLGDDLERCLNLFDIDHTDPSHAGYYLTEYFSDILKRCDGHYRDIARRVHSISPKTQMIVHGYDHITPWCEGIFLGQHMKTRGLDPCGHLSLCEAIVQRMIDRFNDVLSNLARSSPNFTHVNLRGTLERDIWDEIHPKSAGAKRLAAKMEEHLGPHVALSPAAVESVGA